MDNLKLTVQRLSQDIVLSIDNSKTGEYYDGPYEVIPMARVEQTLATREKLMRRNVHVLEIPYYETTNPNGTTVYIGE